MLQIDFDGDTFDFENGHSSFSRTNEMDRSLWFTWTHGINKETKVYRKTPAKNIRQPRIDHLDACLPEIERDVLHISLYLTKGKTELMVLLVGDSRIERELDEIMCLNHHDVLDKVALELSMILEDQINGVIGVLDARNGNVADL
jgi:hypothetical protein